MMIFERTDWDYREWFSSVYVLAERMPGSILVALEETEEMPRPLQIATGLDIQAALAVYLKRCESHLWLNWPNGYSIEYDPSLPERLVISGSPDFEMQVSRFLEEHRFSDTATQPVYPVALSEGVRVQELMRVMFRTAQKCGAVFYVADSGENRGRMIRVTASWLLDTCEFPLILEIRFQDGSFIVCDCQKTFMLYSENRIDEAMKLLDHM